MTSVLCIKVYRNVVHLGTLSLKSLTVVKRPDTDEYHVLILTSEHHWVSERKSNYHKQQLHIQKALMNGDCWD